MTAIPTQLGAQYLTMDWPTIFQAHGSLVIDRAALDARGLTARAITAAVDAGRVIRVRRGLYVLPGTPDTVTYALRRGGRVACVSALAAAGVFVYERPSVHLQVDPSSPCLRSSTDSDVSTRVAHRRGLRAHWRPLIDPGRSQRHLVSPIDALVQSVYCQSTVMAVASLDSALNLGYLHRDELGEVFRHLPIRFQRLKYMVDWRCQSGVESVFRLLLVEAGIPFDLQVLIPRVGHVDFLIAGRIVVETDGFEFHGPATAARDYARDLELIAQGYIVIRLNYRQVMFEQTLVLGAITRALETLAVHKLGRSR